MPINLVKETLSSIDGVREHKKGLYGNRKVPLLNVPLIFKIMFSLLACLLFLGGCPKEKKSGPFNVEWDWDDNKL